ncbi:MAG TPA: hypothetical protein VN493_30285 [Thermoanaerobaculia bacterium]|nr:hypothetical protein [Thermoanaerobaculia bacterium]
MRVILWQGREIPLLELRRLGGFCVKNMTDKLPAESGNTAAR